MKINTDTRTVTLETNTRPCRHCYGRGEVPTQEACPTGGRGPRGGRNGCRTCHGIGRHTNFQVMEVCPTCEGEDPQHATDDSLYDLVRHEVFADHLEWVVRDGTDMEFTSLGMVLGSGMGHVIDYGRHLSMTDEELTREVRDRETSTQWVNIVRKDDMRLADAIVITRLANGYRIAAEWK